MTDVAPATYILASADRPVRWPCGAMLAVLFVAPATARSFSQHVFCLAGKLSVHPCCMCICISHHLHKPHRTYLRIYAVAGVGRTDGRTDGQADRRTPLLAFFFSNSFDVASFLSKLATSDALSCLVLSCRGGGGVLNVSCLRDALAGLVPHAAGDKAGEHHRQ